MDKIEWFKKLAAYREGASPFGRPFAKGASLYATDSFCILRTACDEELAERFGTAGLELTTFWKTMNVIFKNVTPKGKIDALLLKDMAGEADWENDFDDGVIQLLGSNFYKRPLARALMGWEAPEGKISIATSKDLSLKMHSGQVVSADTPTKSPVLLTSKDVQVILLPLLLDPSGDPVDVFPEDAIIPA